MQPNVMHLSQKVNFKIALEIFTPVSGHLKTAIFENSQHIFSLQDRV